jgi:hypothetical protein
MGDADQWRRSGTVPNGRLLKKILWGLGAGIIMMVYDLRACLRIFIAFISWLIFSQPGTASDVLSQSPRVGTLRIPLVSYELIPIATVLAHPERYQMREIRLTGIVTMIQTETVTNKLICGRVHERTVFTVKDDSGQIEIIDQGACGRNVSSLKVPLLNVGQQINLLVLIILAKYADQSEPSLEVTIRFLDLIR